MSILTGIRHNTICNMFKEKLGILSSIRDHREKVGKQGRSPTPADILVNIK